MQLINSSARRTRWNAVTCLYLVLILCSASVSAQDKMMTIPLKAKGFTINDHEYIQEQVDLGENGFIIKVGANNKTRGASKDSWIYYFNANGDLKYKIQLESEFFGPFSLARLIAAPDGSVVYEVEIKKHQVFVYRISSDALIKKVDLSGYGIGKNVQSTFCDANHLYILCSTNGNEKHKSKKQEELLVLHRFNNTNFQHKKFTLTLPAVPGDKNSSFWSFIGQKGSSKYLVSKYIDPAAQKNFIKIAAFDSEGVVTNITSLDFGFPGREFERSTPLSKTSYGFEQFVDLDRTEISASPNVPGRTEFANTAFASVFMDQHNDIIYLAGALKGQGITDDFFVQCFTLEGKPKWKQIFNSSAKQIETFYFSILPGGKTVNFGYMNEGKYVVHEIDETGTQKSAVTLDYRMTNFRGFDETITSGKFIRGVSNGTLPKSAGFIKTLDEKQKKLGLFSNYLSSQGEIFTFCERQGTLLILFFNQ